MNVIVEFLTYCQFFIILVLEQYCFEKSIQIRTMQYQESLYIPDIYSVENCPVVSIQTETPTVEVSDIVGTEAEELLAALQQELGEHDLSEVSAPMDTDYTHELIPAVAFFNDAEGFVDEHLVSHFPNCLEPDFESDPMVNEEDCLSLDDLLDSEQPAISMEYQQCATAKIADNLMGDQQWTVLVLGKEGPYIHVSDGRRIWLDLGEKSKLIHRNDVLSVEVSRKDDGKIEVLRTIKLEEAAYVSEDYLIPDEEYLLKRESRMIG
ncbi:hypothetical protein HPT25_27700 [Bacillus sp. BRMEA1]|uniref:hypothetical protein n=1 Tax=Neobacillus endophyticus TaxID=2738405 RepID=UPI0015666A95|nr:hypothetical protein [Neobacillus endophyticus]NRD81081.1 hypothetical protein [Neobacillus endophyticus]